MNVYKQEILDGVGEAVKATASVAYCTQACVSTHHDPSPVIDKIVAANANPQQVDLYYIKSVLVSTGWNKNDDVFGPDITFAARNTPEDKQFNFMHDENDIIGHITGSYVVDRNGDRIKIHIEDEYSVLCFKKVFYLRSIIRYRTLNSSTLHPSIFGREAFNWPSPCSHNLGAVK